MRRAVWLVPLCLFAFRLDAQAPNQLPKPSPEQKRLEAFLGKWTTDGDAKASPYGPAGKIAATDTFEWLPGGFFMLHRAEGRQGTIESKWIEVIGYDVAKKVYTTHTFDNFGNSVLWQGTWNAKTLTWTADSFIAGKLLKERCPINVDSPDKLVVKCEFSTDGGATWQLNVATTMTRTK